MVLVPMSRWRAASSSGQGSSTSFYKDDQDFPLVVLEAKSSSKTLLIRAPSSPRRLRQIKSPVRRRPTMTPIRTGATRRSGAGCWRVGFGTRCPRPRVEPARIVSISSAGRGHPGQHRGDAGTPAPLF
jgi:hypothetical protein